MHAKIADCQMRPVVVIALITAACLIGDSMLYIALPIHWQEAGLASLWEVGLMLSINRLVRLPLNPVIGWLYTKISTRNGILFAVGLAAATTAAYGVVHSFWVMLLARCLWGMAWTFLRLGGYFTILELAEDCNRGYYMGTYNGLFRLGSLIGMLAGGLLADFYGLKVTAITFALITLSSLPFVFFYVPNVTMKSRSLTKRLTEEALWKNTTVLYALGIGLIIAMVYQGMLMSTLSYVIKTHHFDGMAEGSFIVGAATLAGTLQALRWTWELWLSPWVGRLSDTKYSRSSILIATLSVSSILFSLIPFHIPFTLWVIIVLLLQVTATILTTVGDSIASDAASCTSKMAVMTAYAFATDLGAALGPMLSYTINGIWGAYASYWGAGAMLALLATQSRLINTSPREIKNAPRS